MTRTTSIRLLCLSLALGGLWTAFTQQQAPEGLEIAQVRGNLHVITGSGGNVGVLATDDGVVLVDDKFERNVEDILAKVKTVSAKPIRYVLNTHHHGDHSGGNAKLMPTASIVAHENARANMVRGNQPGQPEVTFAEQVTLHVGGTEVRSLHFGRGHTDGDAVIYFPSLRTIHTGDLFVSGAPFIDYANGGSALEWDETLNAVLQLEFDTVIPGHGPVMTREDLAQWKQSFETYRERISDAARDGKSPDEVAASVKLDDLPGWSIGRLQARSLEGLLRELR